MNKFDIFDRVMGYAGLITVSAIGFSSGTVSGVVLGAALGAISVIGVENFYRELMKPKEKAAKALDLSWLSSEIHQGGKFKIITDGLLEGLDVSAYAKPEFDERQMLAIKDGLRNGIDVSSFAKPEFSADQMRVKSAELQLGRHGVDFNIPPSVLELEDYEKEFLGQEIPDSRKGVIDMPSHDRMEKQQEAYKEMFVEVKKGNWRLKDE